jgi:CspA family cold shock protein
MTGVVKKFFQNKGYGFITPDDGGKDLFFHFSQVAGDHPKRISEGEAVSFEIGSSDRGPMATAIARQD